MAGDKKTLVFIIPGASVRTIPVFGEWLAKLIINNLGSDKMEENWVLNFCEYLKGQLDVDAEVFHWSQGIFFTSVNPAATKLASMIDCHEAEKVILFGKSMGGVVAHETLMRVKNKNKVIRLVCVATPHKHKHLKLPPGVEVINVFSESDWVQDVGNKTVNFCLGSREVAGAHNIRLKGADHFVFNKNILIEHAGRVKLMFDFYVELILGLQNEK